MDAATIVSSDPIMHAHLSPSSVGGWRAASGAGAKWITARARPGELTRLNRSERGPLILAVDIRASPCRRQELSVSQMQGHFTLGCRRNRRSGRFTGVKRRVDCVPRWDVIERLVARLNQFRVRRCFQMPVSVSTLRCPSGIKPDLA